MKINIKHTCEDFTSFRAEKVKSLFNAESGHTWQHIAELPIEGDDWQIGLIVGPSGSGKTSIGKQIWNNGIINLSEGWNPNLPIVEDIAPEKSINEVTAALSAVGLGDVPAWLRPFKVLSNGEQFRAGLARLICEDYDKIVVDEFTSVVDRQIAKIGASAFAKAWRRGKRQIVLLACHYDIIDWLQPDWVYDTREGVYRKKSQAVPLSSSTFGRQTAVTGSFLNRITI